MSLGARFSFDADDPLQLGTTDEVRVLLHEEFVRFRITCWEGTVIAQPCHEDLVACGVHLLTDYKERRAWVTKFRAAGQTNVWAHLLLDPTQLAVWFGAWRMRVSDQVTELLCIVTEDEFGIEIGRAEGRFM